MLALVLVGKLGVQAWGCGQQGLGERPLCGDLACCPGLPWAVVRMSAGWGWDAHWGPADKNPGSTQCPLSVRTGPPVLTGQAVIVPGHLSRGNSLVPGSLWVGGPEPRQALSRAGALPLEARGQKEGSAPFPLCWEEGRFQVGCRSVTVVASSDGGAVRCLLSEVESGPGAGQAVLRGAGGQWEQCSWVGK